MSAKATEDVPKMKGEVTMRFMLLGTWDPGQRDGLYRERLKEGRMVPGKSKVIGEWLDVAGGRHWALLETYDAQACFHWANSCSKLCTYELVPVVEDDMATIA